MNYRLIIKLLAEQDMYESYIWYNGKQQGLGEDLLSEIERSLDFIQTNPYQYQVRYKDIRMAKVRRFPICLYYTIGHEAVYIQAALSTYQNPRIWKKRS